MLLELVILQLCLEMNKVDYAACTNAFRAASLQTNIAQDLNKFERQSLRFLRNKAEELTSKDFLVVSGVVLYSIRSKSISYQFIKTPDGLIPATAATVGINRCVIGLQWTF